MSVLVPIAMFGWPLLVVVLFAALSPSRAAMIGMLGAWLFLPMAGYTLPGLPDLTKMSITCVSVFFGAALFDARRLMMIRWSPVDLAMLVWVLVPVPSALSAGYSPYDGFSASVNHLVAWGMPYIVGKMYFGTGESLRELAMATFIAGLVYVPLVLFEARMSPQLHSWVYGFHQHQFLQSRRGDGWRPTVFMQHGLMVALFLCASVLCGTWMWLAGGRRAMWSVPTGLVVTGLIGVQLACRSVYASLLMAGGLMAMVVSRQMKAKWAFTLLMVAAPVYIVVRAGGVWDADAVRDLARMMGQDRIESIDVRFTSERALLSWVDGSLTLGRFRLDEIMNAESTPWGRFIPDGLWLIALGRFGVVGLFALYSVLLLPAVLYLWRHRTADILGTELAGATALMVVLSLYAMDNLLNAMISPLFLLAAGGLGVLHDRSARQGWRARGADRTLNGIPARHLPRVGQA